MTRTNESALTYIKNLIWLHFPSLPLFHPLLSHDLWFSPCHQSRDPAWISYIRLMMKLICGSFLSSQRKCWISYAWMQHYTNQVICFKNVHRNLAIFVNVWFLWKRVKNSLISVPFSSDSPFMPPELSNSLCFSHSQHPCSFSFRTGLGAERLDVGIGGGPPFPSQHRLVAKPVLCTDATCQLHDACPCWYVRCLYMNQKTYCLMEVWPNWVLFNCLLTWFECTVVNFFHPLLS